jgi:hypothetical protein
MIGTIHKNFNIPWFIATGLAGWFLAIHTPSFWINRQLPIRDILLAIHISSAGTVYIACAHNSVFTPSFVNMFGVQSKMMHIWVGRIGLIAGILSVSFGMYLTWSRLGLPTENGGTTLGFSIPITIGGICQLIAEYNGYFSIRLYQTLRHEIEAKLQQSKEESIDSDIDELTRPLWHNEMHCRNTFGI